MAIEDYTIRDRRPRAYLDDGRYFDTDLINVNEIRDPASVLRGSFAYVVTSSFNPDRFTSDPRRFPRQNAFYQSLEQEARLIAEFRPGKGGLSYRSTSKICTRRSGAGPIRADGADGADLRM